MTHSWLPADSILAFVPTFWQTTCCILVIPKSVVTLTSEPRIAKAIVTDHKALSFTDRPRRSHSEPGKTLTRVGSRTTSMSTIRSTDRLTTDRSQLVAIPALALVCLDTNLIVATGRSAIGSTESSSRIQSVTLIASTSSIQIAPSVLTAQWTCENAISTIVFSESVKALTLSGRCAISVLAPGAAVRLTAIPVEASSLIPIAAVFDLMKMN